MTTRRHTLPPHLSSLIHPLASFQPSRSPALAASTAAAHLELVPAPPRFDALDAALAAAALGDRHHGEPSSSSPSTLPPGPTFAALAAASPASPAELCAALAVRRAFACPARHGGIRILEAGYAASLTDWFLAAAAAGGWPLASIPVAAALESAASEGGFHPAVAAVGLARLARPPPGLEAALVAGVMEEEGGSGGGRPSSGGADAGAGAAGPAPPLQATTLAAALAAGTLPTPHPPSLALDPDAVRLHAASKLLARTPRWAAALFEVEWAAALPPGVGLWDDGEGSGGSEHDPAAARPAAARAAARPHAWRALAGEAILDGPAGAGTNGAPTPILPGARPARVTAFPSSALPSDPPARAAALFAARPRWTAGGIGAFLAPLVCVGHRAGGRTLAGMLLAHARASAGEGGGPTLYSAR